MPFLENVRLMSGRSEAFNCVIHGHAGTGKTTFAFSRPDVVGIPIEQGLGVLTAELFPQPRSFSEIMEMLRELAAGDHSFTGVVLDTVDGIAPLIEKDVCDEHGKKSLADFGFGKGNVLADQKWHELLRGCDFLSKHKGISPILISHSSAVHYDDPVAGTHVRWEPSVGKRVVPILVAWGDIVGFIDREKAVVDKGSDNRTVRTTIATGVRTMSLDDTGSAIAKNRYGLSSSLVVPPTNGWAALQSLIDNAFKKAAGTAKAKEAA
jgi:hypothetical protein